MVAIALATAGLEAQVRAQQMGENMRNASLIGAALLSTALGACSFNPHSLPIPQYVPLQNVKAVEFIRSPALNGPAESELGRGDLAIDPQLARRPLFDDGRLVFLTVSGGGMRASAFALGAMTELEQIAGPDDNALGMVDAISSNSGGSWAVAAMLADRVAAPDAALVARNGQILGRFAKLRPARVKCWARDMRNAFGNEAMDQPITFEQVYASAAGTRLPRVYFNSSIYPSQSPFVFTHGYVHRYEVDRFFGHCDKAPDEQEPAPVKPDDSAILNTPIGLAAATSGSVPGFTNSFATTNLCRDEERGASFCLGNHPHSYLELFDGGLYDNIGYKTALELALQWRDLHPEAHRTLISIDSATESLDFTVARRDRKASHAVALVAASTFPNQNATFSRLRGPAFAAAGFKDQVLLDFAATGDFDLAANADMLGDLPDLVYYAAYRVACLDGRGKEARGQQPVGKKKRAKALDDVPRMLRDLERRGPDCAAQNFMRTGMLHKTTYLYDEKEFLPRYELGRLVVRMKCDEIATSLGIPATACARWRKRLP